MLSDGTELAQTRGGTPGRPQIPSLLEHFKACEMAIQVALTIRVSANEQLSVEDIQCLKVLIIRSLRKANRH